MRCLLDGHDPVQHAVRHRREGTDDPPLGTPVWICRHCAKPMSEPLQRGGYQALEREEAE